MSSLETLDTINTLNEYEDYTKNLNLSSLEITLVELDVPMLYALNKVKELETEYFSYHHQFGAAIMLSEKLLFKSMSWSTAKRFLYLLKYWLKQSLSFLNDDQAWWPFVKKMIELIQKFYKKWEFVRNEVMFVLGTLLLDGACHEHRALPQVRKILCCFNFIAAYSDKATRVALYEKLQPYIVQLGRWLSHCGDSEAQTLALEAMMRVTVKRHLRTVRLHTAAVCFPAASAHPHLADLFASLTFEDFDADSRRFLNALNELEGSVFSILCDSAYWADLPLLPYPSGSQLWVDVNRRAASVSLGFDGGALASATRPQPAPAQPAVRDLLTLHDHNVRAVRLSRSVLRHGDAALTMVEVECVKPPHFLTQRYSAQGRPELLVRLLLPAPGALLPHLTDVFPGKLVRDTENRDGFDDQEGRRVESGANVASGAKGEGSGTTKGTTTATENKSAIAEKSQSPPASESTKAQTTEDTRAHTDETSAVVGEVRKALITEDTSGKAPEEISSSPFAGPSGTIVSGVHVSTRNYYTDTEVTVNTRSIRRPHVSKTSWRCHIVQNSPSTSSSSIRLLPEKLKSIENTFNLFPKRTANEWKPALSLVEEQDNETYLSTPRNVSTVKLLMRNSNNRESTQILRQSDQTKGEVASKELHENIRDSIMKDALGTANIENQDIGYSDASVISDTPQYDRTTYKRTLPPEDKDSASNKESDQPPEKVSPSGSDQNKDLLNNTTNEKTSDINQSIDQVLQISKSQMSIQKHKSTTSVKITQKPGKTHIISEPQKSIETSSTVKEIKTSTSSEKDTKSKDTSEKDCSSSDFRTRIARKKKRTNKLVRKSDNISPEKDIKSGRITTRPLDEISSDDENVPLINLKTRQTRNTNEPQCELPSTRPIKRTHTSKSVKIPFRQLKNSKKPSQEKQGKSTTPLVHSPEKANPVEETTLMEEYGQDDLHDTNKTTRQGIVGLDTNLPTDLKRRRKLYSPNNEDKFDTLLHKNDDDSMEDVANTSRINLLKENKFFRLKRSSSGTSSFDCDISRRVVRKKTPVAKTKTPKIQLKKKENSEIVMKKTRQTVKAKQKKDSRITVYDFTSESEEESYKKFKEINIRDDSRHSSIVQEHRSRPREKASDTLETKYDKSKKKSEKIINTKGDLADEKLRSTKKDDNENFILDFSKISVKEPKVILSKIDSKEMSQKSKTKGQKTTTTRSSQKIKKDKDAKTSNGSDETNVTLPSLIIERETKKQQGDSSSDSLLQMVKKILESDRLSNAQEIDTTHDLLFNESGPAKYQELPDNNTEKINLRDEFNISFSPDRPHTPIIVRTKSDSSINDNFDEPIQGADINIHEPDHLPADVFTECQEKQQNLGETTENLPPQPKRRRSLSLNRKIKENGANMSDGPNTVENIKLPKLKNDAKRAQEARSKVIRDIKKEMATDFSKESTSRASDKIILIEISNSSDEIEKSLSSGGLLDKSPPRIEDLSAEIVGRGTLGTPSSDVIRNLYVSPQIEIQCHNQSSDSRESLDKELNKKKTNSKSIDKEHLEDDEPELYFDQKKIFHQNSERKHDSSDRGESDYSGLICIKRYIASYSPYSDFYGSHSIIDDSRSKQIDNDEKVVKNASTNIEIVISPNNKVQESQSNDLEVDKEESEMYFDPKKIFSQSPIIKNVSNESIKSDRRIAPIRRYGESDASDGNDNENTSERHSYQSREKRPRIESDETKNATKRVKITKSKPQTSKVAKGPLKTSQQLEAEMTGLLFESPILNILGAIESKPSKDNIDSSRAEEELMASMVDEQLRGSPRPSTSAKADVRKPSTDEAALPPVTVLLGRVEAGYRRRANLVTKRLAEKFSKLTDISQFKKIQQEMKEMRQMLSVAEGEGSCFVLDCIIQWLEDYLQ